MIKLMLITNDVRFAKEAENAGVDRIFVDLEINGKQARQGHLDTFITSHSMSDAAKIKNVLTKAQLLVRLNPLFEGTANEIDQAIEAGANLLMLPMFHSADELAEFSRLVDGRAGIIPLIETASAMRDLDRILGVEGLTELFVGLNDLHLDMGLDFMFELLSNGTIEAYATKAKANGFAFGFGGVARMEEGLVTGRAVLSEHVRLGSSSVILSRTFCRTEPETGLLDYDAFAQSVSELRNQETLLAERNEGELLQDKLELADAISLVISKIRIKKNIQN